MKKNIFITLLLALIFSFHHAFAEEAQNKAEGFKIKLPDGLYLYQPKIKEEVFSPLFIVEKGALVDPYALAVKIGEKKFIKDYVEGKRFHVYIEGVTAGILTEVKFEFVNVCYSDEFLPDIRGKGKYEGKPLKKAYSNKSLYAFNEYERSDGSLKAIAAPVELTTDKALKDFEVTEKNKAMTVEAVRKNFVPGAFELIKKRLETLYEEKQVITGQWGKLKFLKSFNKGGNKKGLIGLYTLYVSFRDAARQEGIDAGYSAEILFSMVDNKIEQVAFVDGYEPAYNLGGVIDTDGDGITELILEEGIISDKEPEDGKNISILRQTSAGWKEIYHSERICGPIF
ncbi:MAG: hypothetical protein HY893_09810 [Deltaproteobacteria bacterium]|nr:hypothetical protein [Deltaproteobacteria bacterium]